MARAISRRTALKGAALLGAAASRPARAFNLGTTPARDIAAGPFTPDWSSLRNYRTPEWFRDAKFGIWAHWSAQCVPEQGDWYARKMYLQGEEVSTYHREHYGHPSKFGFMEIDNLWKAERWQPDLLMDLYQAAGAKYFVALANHHDNFDNFASRHHAWNSTRIGPKQDIIGRWSRVARQRGLRFGVSNHSAHTWHWFQPAYGYDAVGPLMNVRYDAYTLTKADGKGKWWDGLDPQELYAGRNLVMPDGLDTIAAQNTWHENHDRVWSEQPPVDNPRFADQWYLRFKDLVDSYAPDFLYLDDDELPLGQAGLDAAAHYYNTSFARHGSVQCVLTAKHPKPDHEGAFTTDIERSRATGILAQPWQTDTCIGDWHYRRSLFEDHAYKKPGNVIALLLDIVSKNGNLLLSIPIRGDGTIDEDEHAFLRELAGWVPMHGEAIFGTRPFTVFGEGPPEPIEQNFSEKTRPFTAEDIRFTTRDGLLYAAVLAWPTDGQIRIQTLRSGGEHSKAVARVELIGAHGALPFKQTSEALIVTMPDEKPNPYAYVLRIAWA